MTAPADDNLKTRILAFAERRAGAPFGAADLEAFASQAAITQALSRMSRNGELERAGRGRYLFLDRKPSPAPVSASKKERALAVASSLFAEKGFFGVSIRDIADASGVNTATIYHHFPDKVSLYNEVVRIAWDEGARQILLSDPGDATPREQFERWLTNIIRFHFANSEAARIRDREMFLGSWDFIGTNDEILRPTRSNSRAIEQLVEQMAPPILADMSARRVSELVYALVYGLIKFLPTLSMLYPDEKAPDVGAIRADVMRFIAPTLGW